MAESPPCPTLGDAKRKDLSDYVRKKYQLPASVSLTLLKEFAIPGTCYHQLSFQGKSDLRQWDLTLFLTPDERYLTGELMDTRTDPIEDERRKAMALMSSLAENKGASRGPNDAPVTIVEFSDFECPFCGKFNSILKEALPEGNDRARVVFHHLPLNSHPWARTAAQGAGCAQLQSSKAFWAFTDKLFEQQEQTSAANIRDRLMEVARSIGDLDLQSFQSCLESDMSLGLVLRDMNLASSVGVNATPTLFINGHRVMGVKDASDLQKLIAEAEKEAPPPLAPLRGPVAK